MFSATNFCLYYGAAADVGASSNLKLHSLAKISLQWCARGPGGTGRATRERWAKYSVGMGPPSASSPYPPTSLRRRQKLARTTELPDLAKTFFHTLYYSTHIVQRTKNCEIFIHSCLTALSTC